LPLCSIIVKRLAAPRVADPSKITDEHDSWLMSEEWCMASNGNRLMGSCWNRWMGKVPKNIRAGVLFGTLAVLLASATILACDVERRKSDAELGLNPQQSAGRKIYDSNCDRCHEPYSTRGKKGPALKGVFQHKYLSLSGLPANDERVTDIIRLGRNEMPGYSQTLSSRDIQDLLGYLHTL
jgi:mono/diheme cytochrome c family protein